MTADEVAKPEVLASGTAHEEKSTLALSEELAAILKSAKTGFGTIVRTYARLAAGRGRISPRDFIDLRLFDPDFIAENDARRFVGAQRFASIILSVNAKRDWIAVLSDKVASYAYLTAFGIPTIPITAIYRSGMKAGKENVITDRTALEAFLLRKDVYPLFGKPSNDQNSLGSMALTGCDSAKREAITSTGRHITVETIASVVDEQYGTGYIFQPLVMPHPSIAALCGERLACVRFLTIMTKDGPRVLRAAWKIPAGAHMVDNYWRSGNLLAGIDLESGRVLRVTSGVGLAMQEHTEHPDTKAPLIGFVHPEWDAMKALALEGAALMREVPLIGWDIAATYDGPMVVEMNEYPDSFIMQFSDRRGLLDEEFEDFLNSRRMK